MMTRRNGDPLITGDFGRKIVAGVIVAAMVGSWAYIWSAYGQEIDQQSRLDALEATRTARKQIPLQLQKVQTRVDMIEGNQVVILKALTGVQRSLGRIEGKLGIE